MFFYENIFRISDNRYHCNSNSHSLWSDGEQPLQLTISAAPLLFKTKSGAADKALTDAKTVKKITFRDILSVQFFMDVQYIQYMYADIYLIMYVWM